MPQPEPGGDAEPKETMSQHEIENANLFMMCTHARKDAMAELPGGYHFRRILPGELELWKRMHFDDEATANAYSGYMTEWFARVYAQRVGEFFERCIFACDRADIPVGTCFLWNAYSAIPTVHWFKVLKAHEGKGIGRALLSAVMKSADYPVFLHTQPGSYRAIKLYSDFGFSLLLDPVIGSRKNDIAIALPYLRDHLLQPEFEKLSFSHAPEAFLRLVSQHSEAEF